MDEEDIRDIIRDEFRHLKKHSLDDIENLPEALERSMKKIKTSLVIIPDVLSDLISEECKEVKRGANNANRTVGDFLLDICEKVKNRMKNVQEKYQYWFRRGERRWICLRYNNSDKSVVFIDKLQWSPEDTRMLKDQNIKTAEIVLVSDPKFQVVVPESPVESIENKIRNIRYQRKLFIWSVIIGAFLMVLLVFIVSLTIYFVVIASED